MSVSLSKEFTAAAKKERERLEKVRDAAYARIDKEQAKSDEVICAASDEADDAESLLYGFMDMGL